MAPRRKNSALDAIYNGLVVLFLLSYGGVASFWKNLTPQTQQLFVILGIAIVIVGVAFVIVLTQYRKKKRREAWQRAMKNWSNSSINSKVPEFQTAKDLSAAGLEKFAASVYKQMG